MEITYFTNKTLFYILSALVIIIGFVLWNICEDKMKNCKKKKNNHKYTCYTLGAVLSFIAIVIYILYFIYINICASAASINISSGHFYNGATLNELKIIQGKAHNEKNFIFETIDSKKITFTELDRINTHFGLTTTVRYQIEIEDKL